MFLKQVFVTLKRQLSDKFEENKLALLVRDGAHWHGRNIHKPAEAEMKRSYVSDLKRDAKSIRSRSWAAGSGSVGRARVCCAILRRTKPKP